MESPGPQSVEEFHDISLSDKEITSIHERHQQPPSSLQSIYKRREKQVCSPRWSAPLPSRAAILAAWDEEPVSAFLPKSPYRRLYFPLALFHHQPLFNHR